jgi:hypothetical protein
VVLKRPNTNIGIAKNVPSVTVKSLTIGPEMAIDGDGPMEVTDSINITGGVLMLAKTLRIPSSGVLKISGVDDKGISGNIENAGTILVSGSGVFLLGHWYADGRKEILRNLGRIELAPGSYLGPAVGVSPALVNEGDLAIDNARLLVADFTQLKGATVLTNGTVEATAGGSPLVVSGGVISGSGTIKATLENRASVEVVGPTPTLVVGASYYQAANATLRVPFVSSGSSFVTGSLVVAGDVNLAGKLAVSAPTAVSLEANSEVFPVLTFNNGRLTGRFDTMVDLSQLGPHANAYYSDHDVVISSGWLDDMNGITVEREDLHSAHGLRPASASGIGVLHTTESSTLDSALGEFRKVSANAPHFVVGEGRIVQCRPVWARAGSLRDNPPHAANEHAQIQVELVAFSQQKSWSLDPNTEGPALAVLAWCAQTGNLSKSIPLVVPDPGWADDCHDMPLPWATDSNTRRQSGRFYAQDAAGWFEHVEVPYQAPPPGQSGSAHWDCGALQRTELLKNAAAKVVSEGSGNPPTVSGIDPSGGPAAGGTLVMITGRGFTGATDVAFGATNASTVNVDSDTQIAATSPAGGGTVDITVITPAGTSATSSADQFTYSNGNGGS